MTDVGQRSNHFAPNSTACPSSNTLAEFPALANDLADPYNVADLYILDNPIYSITTEYLKSGNVRDPLQTTGNFASFQATDITSQQILDELAFGRPVLADIQWPSGLEHVVAIAGLEAPSWVILDPVNGQSLIAIDDFPAKYLGGARLLDYVFTQA